MSLPLVAVRFHFTLVLPFSFKLIDHVYSISDLPNYPALLINDTKKTMDNVYGYRTTFFTKLVGYVGRNLPNGRTSAEEILKNSSHLGDGTFLVRSHLVSRIKKL
jgi:hypothetical protein